jgi:hypothetical protein
MSHKFLTLTSLGLLSLIAVPSYAAFVGLPNPTAETPGVAMDPNTVVGVGTVIRTFDSAFADNASPSPFASGTLRTLVVDRGAGLLDFYYQLVNTSAAPVDLTKEFFRLTIDRGFTPESILSVANTNSLTGLTAGVGSGFVSGNYTQGAALEDAATADRGVSNALTVGFDFPTQPPTPFIGDARNVGQGEASSFLIVRTSSTTFRTTGATVSGAATSFPTTLAAVPEPATVLIGLALTSFVGCTELGRNRRRKGTASKS